MTRKERTEVEKALSRYSKALERYEEIVRRYERQYQTLSDELTMLFLTMETIKLSADNKDASPDSTLWTVRAQLEFFTKYIREKREDTPSFLVREEEPNAN